MLFRDCCREVLASSETDMYARSYARAGVAMTDREEKQAQALYLVSNLRGWRGPVALRVKDNLRRFAATGQEQP